MWPFSKSTESNTMTNIFGDTFRRPSGTNWKWGGAYSRHWRVWLISEVASRPTSVSDLCPSAVAALQNRHGHLEITANSPQEVPRRW